MSESRYVPDRMVQWNVGISALWSFHARIDRRWASIQRWNPDYVWCEKHNMWHAKPCMGAG